MTQYRRKLDVVEALQFTEELLLRHLIDKEPLPGDVFLAYAKWETEKQRVHEAQLYRIGEEEQVFGVGDWIITDADGSQRLLRRAVFEARYESVRGDP